MLSSNSRVRVLFYLSVATTLGCAQNVRAQAHTAATTPAGAKRSASAIQAASPDAPNSARLESQSCAEFERHQNELAEVEIETMRADSAQGLLDWRAEQPACWEEYRQNAEYWKEIGESFGVGGLGLSGIGEGGGGRGEGIGLGSIGSIGSGQGFGSGHGRLGGSHMTRAPKLRASATNVQVEGVDEADMVQSDGKHVYFALNGALRVASVDPPRLVSVTPLSGRVKELFLHNGRGAVYVSVGGSEGSRCSY